MKRSFLLPVVAGALSVAALAGCATAPIGCPVARNYTEQQKQDITAAMQALAPDSPLRGAMLDYEELLEDSRACGQH